MIENILIVVFALAIGGVLLWPRFSAKPGWRATVTPLASIIGSGFLVAAPVLAHTVGDAAVFAMAGLCAAGWLFGMAIRHNIAHVESKVEHGKGGILRGIDTVASLALAFAYWVSVAYYLNLFAAFGLRGFDITDQLWIRGVTSTVLVVLGCVGVLRGLKWLEGVEIVAVGLKLGVIGGLLVGLAASLLLGFGGSSPGASPHELPGLVEQGQILLGLIILIQGFETSRYLGKAYDADLRVRTMRRAQIIATVIYVSFIGLATPWFAGPLPETGGETAIIDILSPMAAVVVPLLILVALASQLSAAVADMNGSSGLMNDVSKDRIPMRAGYALTALAAIAITWSADIFQIIVYASKAFALYYGLQSGLAAFSALRADQCQWGRALFFAAATLLAVGIIAFGMPAES